MNIQVSKSELKKTGNSLRGISDDLKTEASKVNNILTDLEGHWVGTDATNFFGIMKEQFIPNMNEVANLVNKQGEYLTKVPEAYDLIDTVYSKKPIK